MKPTSLLRGFYHSDDGVITEILAEEKESVTFTAAFSIPDHLLDPFRANPGHLMFSQRSRIARLGVMISSEPLSESHFKDSQVIITMQIGRASCRERVS
jgi:hypothetical protein